MSYKYDINSGSSCINHTYKCYILPNSYIHNTLQFSRNTWLQGQSSRSKYPTWHLLSQWRKLDCWVIFWTMQILKKKITHTRHLGGWCNFSCCLRSRLDTLRAALVLPCMAGKTFQSGWMAGEIILYLPYMAGKISSCKFRDTITQEKSNMFSTVQIEPVAWKQLIDTNIVHTEKSLPCSFYHTFWWQLCQAGRNYLVNLLYLAGAFKSYCWALNMVTGIFNMFSDPHTMLIT